MTFRVNNGPEQTLDAPERGLNKLKFPVALSDGVVRLDFTRVNGEHHLLYDSQRDYRRSSFGASPLPGEWIMRLLTPPAHP